MPKFSKTRFGSLCYEPLDDACGTLFPYLENKYLLAVAFIALSCPASKLVAVWTAFHILGTGQSVQHQSAIDFFPFANN